MRKARRPKICGALSHNGFQYYLHSQYPKIGQPISLYYRCSFRKINAERWENTSVCKDKVKLRLQMPPNVWQINQRQDHLQNQHCLLKQLLKILWLLLIKNSMVLLICWTNIWTFYINVLIRFVCWRSI